MTRDTKRVSVPLVAAVSGLVHGAASVVAIPTLTFLFLTTVDTSPRAGGMAATELGMLIAVLAPVLCAMLGAAGGAIMAFLYNMFVEETPRPAIEAEQSVPLPEASSLGDAA
jgi:hypothetical protein